MTKEPRSDRGGSPGEAPPAAHRRDLESRLQEIGAEISRLRRERKQVVEEFRAFTSGVQAAAETPAGSTLARRVERVGHTGHALETYAAKLADRGPRVPPAPPTDREEHPPPRRRHRPVAARHRSRPLAARIAIPTLLVAVAAGSLVVVRGWLRQEAPAQATDAQPAVEAPLGRPGEAVDSTTAPAASPPLPEPVATSGQADAAPLRVEIVTLREVWLRASVDDAPASSRVLATGETVVLDAERLVELRAGDAGAVVVRVNGEDLGPLGRDGEVVTRRIEADAARREP